MTSKRSNRGGGIAAALAMSLGLLVGCSPASAHKNHSSDSKASIADATAKLNADLVDMGFSFVEVKTQSFDGSVLIQVGVAHASFSIDDVIAVEQRAAQTCAPLTLRRIDCNLDLVGVDGSRFIFSVLDIETVQIEKEVVYAFELAEIVDGVPYLSISRSAGANYNRTAGIWAPGRGGVQPYTIAQWDALRGVADSSTADRVWIFGGVMAQVSFPPKAATDFFAEASQIVPSFRMDVDPLPDYMSLQWDGEAETTSVEISAGTYTPDLSAQASPIWPDVLSVVQLSVDSGYPTRFRYYGQGDCCRFG